MNRLLMASILALTATTGAAMAQDRSQMTFFITSANPGNGANFGGLEGADRHCQTLAAAVGAGNRTWRAYLSTSAANGRPAVHARDRIGNGPWRNAVGTLIAQNVDDLHRNSQINKANGLTEKGEQVSGSGDPVNNHDILTGSTADGRAFDGAEDRTCRNWTSGTDGAAMTGHHDRRGLNDSEQARSWNSSHPSRGCSLELLRTTGGGGLIYCFAAN